MQGQGHFMMTKCSKIRLQVSVLRTNGPLACLILHRLRKFLAIIINKIFFDIQ